VDPRHSPGAGGGGGAPRARSRRPKPVAGADDGTFPRGDRGSKVPPDDALRPDPWTVSD